MLRFVFILLVSTMVATGVVFQQPVVHTGRMLWYEISADVALAQNKPQHAIQLYQRAFAIGQGDRPQPLLKLASYYSQQHNYKQALATYTQLAQARPSLWQGPFGQGLMAQALNQPVGEAQQYYETAATKPNAHLVVFSKLAGIYTQLAADPTLPADTLATYRTKAERTLLAAQKQDTENPHWPYALGQLYQQQGQPKPAMQAYCKALALNPTLHPARLNLALVLLQQNDPQQALSQANYMVANSPENYIAKAMHIRQLAKQQQQINVAPSSLSPANQTLLATCPGETPASEEVAKK